MTIYPKIHFVIYGVGAVGGFYGVKLANYLKTHPEAYALSFVARGETFQILNQHGANLLIKSTNTINEINIPSLNVYEKYAHINTLSPEKFTVVLLCTKSKDTISAVEDIKTKFNNNTVIISIQNGITSEAQIASILGTSAVIGALTNIAAEATAPGHYLQKGNYSLILGELDNQITSRCKTICDTLKTADIHALLSNQIHIDMWSKLVWNAAFNPASVLYEMTTGQLLADPKIRQTIKAIMKEVVQVAAMNGYLLAENIIEKHITNTDSPALYDFRTSMLQDFYRAKPIELEELLGIIIHQGKKLGVTTPHAEDMLNQVMRKMSAIL